jgi:putative membrane protein
LQGGANRDLCVPDAGDELPDEGAAWRGLRSRRAGCHRVKTAVYWTALVGLLLATAVLAWAGLPELVRTLTIAGWSLLWLAPFRIFPVALDGAGWRLLVRARAPQARWPYLVWVAAVREAVNSLLPVFGPGGAVVGVRLLMQRAVTSSFSAASVIVEGTVTLASQFLFVLIGIALFVSQHLGAETRLIPHILPGLLITLAVLILLFFAQSHSGLFHRAEALMDRFADKWDLRRLIGSPTGLHRDLRMLYAQRRVVIRSGLWQLAGLLAGAGEVWLALYLFQQPVSLSSALLLESLGQVVRTAAFMMPAGIGVQEASFALFAPMVGLSPQVGVALALAKRLREFVFGIPVLASWQWAEGRRLLSRGTVD